MKNNIKTYIQNLKRESYASYLFHLVVHKIKIKFRWIFSPSNKLNIKNINRSFEEYDERLFHSIMTILCEFIEKDYGGIDKITNAIRERKKDCCCLHKRNLAEMAFVEIYNWYNYDINWEYPLRSRINPTLSNPKIINKVFLEKLENQKKENALKVIQNMKHMWT